MPNMSEDMRWKLDWEDDNDASESDEGEEDDDDWDDDDWDEE